MAKKRVIRCLIIILTIVLAAGVEMFWLSRRKTIKQYKESQAAFGNPLMGYVPSAWYNEVSEDISLLYMDITWAELEPEEGVYNWASIDEENQISRWRKEGKHLVLRFVCDIPSDEEHMDIPEWLYEKSGKAGKWYDGEYGKGFAPDYNSPTIISCHKKAVRAIGEHFGQDGLISYVELGSLGHWGEWHVNYSEGIQRIPREAVRDKYILPWTEAFPDAMILMRRPFAAAEKYGFGLYNDMTGQPEATQSWLGWINNGGEYDQTGEKNVIVPMKDFWKTAPSGGEFTSSLSMEEMLDTIQDTLSDLKALFNNAPDLSIAIRKYLDENAGLKKQVEDFMKEKEAALKERLLKNVQEIHGIKVIKFCSPLPAEVVKNIAFQLRGEITENLFFVAGSTDNGKPMLTVMLSDNLVAGGLKAGNLVKEAAKLIQGGGGGQPHFATAGGKNADGLPAAVEKVLELAGI